MNEAKEDDTNDGQDAPSPPENDSKEKAPQEETDQDNPSSENGKEKKGSNENPAFLTTNVDNEKMQEETDQVTPSSKNGYKEKQGSDENPASETTNVDNEKMPSSSQQDKITQTKKNTPFFPNQRFTTIDELIAAVENHSHKQGFRFAKSFTYVSGTRIVQRGKFKCKKQKDQVCDFLVSFSGKVESGAQHPAFYVIKNVCLEHGHKLCTTYGSEATVKENAQDLNQDEVDFIRQLRNEPPSMIAKNLRERFGGNYSSALISEMQFQISEQVFGSNREGLQKFLDFGYEIKQQGGKFYFSHKHDLSFHCGAFQTKDMVKLHSAYNDHIIQDGELATNVFGISLLPTMVVDGLGKLVISSVILAPSGNANDTVDILEKLELMRPQATYTTDRNPMFPAIATRYSLNHVIGAHHFQIDIEKYVKMKMEALGRNQLKEACSKMMSLESANDFDEEMKAVKSRYSSNGSAMKYLEVLVENKTKICKAYAGRLFSSSGSASQRSDIGYSLVKEEVALTKEQKKQNIFETAIDLNLCDYKSKASKEIIVLLKKGAKWSAWVDKAWKDEALQSLIYTCTQIDDHNYDVAASPAQQEKEEVRRVTLPTSPGVPECNCVQFMSTLIPCRHICCALSFVKETEVFHVNHLKPRWRLENHPLYMEVATKLGIARAPLPLSQSATESPNESEQVDNQASIVKSVLTYDKIDVPTDLVAKVTKLHSLAEQIVRHCTSPHHYKVAYLSLDNLLQKIQGSVGELDMSDSPSQEKRKVNSSDTTMGGMVDNSKRKKRRKDSNEAFICTGIDL